MSCKSILVVEDDDDIRCQVVAALELEDYKVHQAENGQIALEFLLECPDKDYPGCVLLDLMMPVMDGHTLMNFLSANHADILANINIIVATAKGSALNSDALPFAVNRIQKPFELDELYKTVEKYCR